MDFSHSDKVKQLQERLARFMEANVYPSEPAFAAEVEENRRQGNAWVATRIMEALKGISAAGSASLETVAGPIGAALVATGVGIAVAVPAVLVYNYFLRRLKLTAADLDDFAHDFYSLAQKSAFRVLVHPAVHKAQAGFTQPVKEAS